MSAIVEREQFPVARLNRECFCIGADLDALHVWLQQDLAQRGFSRPVVETHPHLFSTLPVFVSREHVMRMQSVIAAVESVVALPAYQAAVLDRAPAIARFAPGPRGVFFGYDFHLGDAGPQLIEINTNAGGALLNAELGRAQRACCDEVRDLMTGPVDVAALENRLVQMFLEEWRLVRGEVPLGRIAIVDEAPASSTCIPEFLLFQRLFEARGMQAVLADPSQLRVARRRAEAWRRADRPGLQPPDRLLSRTAGARGAARSVPIRRHRRDAAPARPRAICQQAQPGAADRRAAPALLGVSDETIATLLSGIPQPRAVDAAEPSAVGRAQATFLQAGCRLRQPRPPTAATSSPQGFAEILQAITWRRRWCRRVSA